ncbi:MAG: hypothetical protein GY698_24510 [Actinomycetia bacterium]|nr:hypothetical protein [Actinomycetes bacterium]
MSDQVGELQVQLGPTLFVKSPGEHWWHQRERGRGSLATNSQAVDLALDEIERLRSEWMASLADIWKADEIVRLQETLERERDVSRALGEDIAAMEAEIRRLRAAETDEVAP